MIERKKYLNQLLRERDNGFPKVITGLRRCRKSYLLKEIYPLVIVPRLNGGSDVDEWLNILR